MAMVQACSRRRSEFVVKGRDGCVQMQNTYGRPETEGSRGVGAPSSMVGATRERTGGNCRDHDTDLVFGRSQSYIVKAILMPPLTPPSP